MNSRILLLPLLLAGLGPRSLSADDTVREQVAKGQKIYLKMCMVCHQADGAGQLGKGPGLISSDWVNARKPDRLIRMVLQGATGPIVVNGRVFTGAAQPMPPQGGALSDADIAHVLTFVRKSFGNTASAVAPSQVQAVRSAEKRHGLWAPAELGKIPEH